MFSMVFLVGLVTEAENNYFYGANPTYAANLNSQAEHYNCFQQCSFTH